MKTKLLAALLALTAGAALAREGDFGLTLGDRTGITGKYWLDETTALDMAAAWSYRNDGLNLHADYLLHTFDTLKDDPAAKWADHAGLGARLKVPENNNTRHNDDATLGIRIALGLDFYPSKLPLEFFAEIAPVLDVIPRTHSDLEFAVGARFYFK